MSSGRSLPRSLPFSLQRVQGGIQRDSHIVKDKLKEKDKKKETKASEQKSIQRHFVKKSDRTSRLRDDSSISINQSFPYDGSSVMDFMP
ncbi:hypothetical protein TNCV_537361 [Trichonephila clavipes]|nr:hypothetical protein TNCV_537361 [Trichonephila clavipes]